MICPQCKMVWNVLGCSLCGLCGGCLLNSPAGFSMPVPPHINIYINGAPVSRNHACEYDPPILTEQEMTRRGIKG